MPTSGPNNGGTPVTVIGSGFINTGQIVVRFMFQGNTGAVNITNAATFLSASTISVITPAQVGFLGMVSVEVSLNNQQFVAASFQFLYYCAASSFSSFSEFVCLSLCGPTICGIDLCVPLYVCPAQQTMWPWSQSPLVPGR